MKPQPHHAHMIPIRVLLALLLTHAANLAETSPENLYRPFPAVSDRSEGTEWPAGQALPTFATPAATLDSILVQDLSRDELITFSSLQGRVNSTQPRIYLLNDRADEGRETWAKTPNLKLGELNYFNRENKYQLLKKYAAETKGIVLYDPTLSPHYRNLAGTVAAIHQAIPATPEIHKQITDAGTKLEILVDLTELEFTTPIEIYKHLHATWWEKCDKRLLVSARPYDRGGDLHHTRDMAAACRAAVVWLDTLKPEEKDVLKLFFADMTAGDAIALGWYATERSGMTTASEFGIGTMPADHYISSTIYSGTDHRINIPPVPKMPELEDKVYVAMFISDGDNIQYTQHAMRKIWDQNTKNRGKVPLNWTIAPGLVDIGPGILNYYYSTATPQDCFVTGPSGMGYLMPFNTLTEPGAPIGNYLKDPVRMDGYATLTGTYLQRSGLRVITIWDDATPMQRASYERHCRNLYGATVQNFRDVRSVAPSIENERVRFDKLVIPYAGSYEHIHRSLTREIRRSEPSSPTFLSYQMDVWHEMKPNRIVQLHDNLAKEHPGKVSFLRADHYFNLYNKAKGLPYNLCLAQTTKITTNSGETHPEDTLTDGTPSTLWTAATDGEAILAFDFGAPRKITRHLIRHAGDHGMSPENNAREFTIHTSEDSENWTKLHSIMGNTENVTDIEFPAVRARYFKITIPAQDNTARISDIEIYGAD